MLIPFPPHPNPLPVGAREFNREAYGIVPPLPEGEGWGEGVV